MSADKAKISAPVRLALICGGVLVPAIAFAATATNPTDRDFVLQLAILVVTTYTAGEVGPLKKRVARVEQRQDDHEAGIIR